MIRPGWVAILLLCFSMAACNRAGARILGASRPFPPARTGYTVRTPISRAVQVAFPTDSREAHLGEPVGGMQWKACGTDPFWGGSASHTLSEELRRELRSSQIFEDVDPVGGSAALVLQTDMRAFCAQAVGFLFIRIAGITSLHFTLHDGNTVLFDETIERVITDADEKYTGPSAGFIEDAMTIALSDSLREVFRELLLELEAIDISPQHADADRRHGPDVSKSP